MKTARTGNAEKSTQKNSKGGERKITETKRQKCFAGTGLGVKEIVPSGVTTDISMERKGKKRIRRRGGKGRNLASTYVIYG